MPRTFRSLEGYENLKPLDKFGKFLMEHLRDRAIEHHDGLASGRWKAPALQQLQLEIQSCTDEQELLIRACLLSAIDAGIHDFLFKLQEQADFENDIQVFVDGVNIVPLSDGIQAEPYGEEGWIARFSKYQAGI